MIEHHDDPMTRVLINGRLVQPISVRWLGGEPDIVGYIGQRDPGVFELVTAQPEPTELLTVGSRVQVQFGGGNPATYRVIGARQLERHPDAELGWPALTYTVELAELMPSQGGEAQPEDTVDVLYRTVFETVKLRTQMRALAQLLVAKGVITGQELGDELAETVRSSFYELAVDIVSEEDATVLKDGMIETLDGSIDALVRILEAKEKVAT